MVAGRDGWVSKASTGSGFWELGVTAAGTGGLAEVVLTRAIVRGDGSGAGGMGGLAKVAGWCCVWCGILIMKLPTAKAHSKMRGNRGACARHDTGRAPQWHSF